MRFRMALRVAALALLALACGSSADDDSGAGAAGAGGPSAGAGGTSAGGRNATLAGSGGTAPGAGGAPNAGGITGGGAAGSAGTAAGRGPGGMGPGAGGLDSGAGGLSSGDGGMGVGGAELGGRGNGRGGRGAGGAGAGSAGMGSAGMGSAGMGMAGTGSNVCPASGSVTYTLTKATNPTAEQQEAYDLITEAMDEAVRYYNCYTNITKHETVTYNPSVETADGNSNGSIRFGGKQYMEYSRAMHEIAHTVGIGTYSEYQALIVGGIFTGDTATAQLREITGVPDDEVHGDSQHFWPYGLNYESEVESEADLINHCLMVVAIRADMGFD
jgi:hypothetical protein